MEARVIENYLKVVFNAGEWSSTPVTTGSLATTLGLAPSTVSEAVGKLTERGMLTHARYGAITLTPEGRNRALAIVRKHRLIETFLVDYLGYTWDEVHDEAEVIEHAVSDTFIDRLDARLGHPELDPHGDPIPQRGGALVDSPDTRLGEVLPGTRVRVDRVHDDDPRLLRQLDQLGISIGSTLTVTRRATESGAVVVEHDSTPTTLAAPAAHAIRVVAVEG